MRGACLVPARPSCPSLLSLGRYLGPRHLGGDTRAHGTVHTSPHTAHPSCAMHAQKCASFLMWHALGGIICSLVGDKRPRCPGRGSCTGSCRHGVRGAGATCSVPGASWCQPPHSHVREVGQPVEGQVVDVGDLQPLQAPARQKQGRGGWELPGWPQCCCRAGDAVGLTGTAAGAGSQTARGRSPSRGCRKYS